MKLTLLIPFLVVGLLQWYAFAGLKPMVEKSSWLSVNVFTLVYVALAVLTAVCYFVLFQQGTSEFFKGFNKVLVSYLFISTIPIVIFDVFLAIDDLGRGFRWVVAYFTTQASIGDGGIEVSRSDFIVKSGMVAGGTLLTALTYGVFRGGHNYKVFRKTITLKGLPKAFDGTVILQLSDIHAGSFWSKDAVKKGVQMAIEQEADMVFFTGDLVNNLASEMDGYKDIFGQISAPMGVYSILGNHDYADYLPNLSQRERSENMDAMIQTHKDLGWRLLMNENVILEKDGEKLAVIGIENWSAHRQFTKYGKLDQAYAGTEVASTKLLLSHDPSHWKSQVLTEYPNIDVTFSGHTHGMQMGVEIGNVKWSPSKFMYPEWAGHYSKGDQHLYVNRGFGYLGYPGRFGIRPEISLITLKSA
jgi:uncharacterized protein